MLDLDTLTTFALAEARAQFGANVEGVRLKAGTDFAGDPALTIWVLVTKWDPSVFRMGRKTSFVRSIMAELQRRGDPSFPSVRWFARDLDEIADLEAAYDAN